jgi:hypothetical protein
MRWLFYKGEVFYIWEVFYKWEVLNIWEVFNKWEVFDIWEMLYKWKSLVISAKYAKFSINFPYHTLIKTPYSLDSTVFTTPRPLASS